MDFHPQLPLVAAVDTTGDAHIADLASGRSWSWAAEARTPNEIRFRPHTNQVLICSPDHGIRFHDIQSGRVITTMPQTNRMGVVWSADGRWLSGHSEDGRVFIWDFNRGGVLDSVFAAHHDFISYSSFDPQGELLLTQSWDGTMALWSLDSHSLLLRWGGGDVQASFSADGRHLGPCLTGRTAHLMEVERAPEYRVLPANAGPLDCNGAFSPDGRWVVVPGANGLECWEVQGWKCIWVEPVDGPRFITFRPDGSRLLVSSKTGLHEWPWVLKSENGPPLLGPARQLSPLCATRTEYSQDGNVLVGSQVGGLCVVSTRSSESTLLPMAMCNFASVAPDGKWAAASPWAGRDSDVRVWQLPSGREALRLDKTQAAVQFTRDGRWLVLVAEERHRVPCGGHVATCFAALSGTRPAPFGAIA